MMGVLPESYDQLDFAASEFIKAAWEEGEPRSLVADVCSGLLYKLQKKKVIPTAWSWLSVWERSELPNRTPPISLEATLAACGVLAAHGFYDIVAVVLLGFHCMLRTAELMGVRVGNIAIGRRHMSVALTGKAAT